MGWMGLLRHLLWALEVVGADREGEEFVVSGSVAVGLGGEEVVVGADASYYVGGRPASLAGLMNGTSYGVRNVTVI